MKLPTYRPHRSRKNGPLRGMCEWRGKRHYFPGLYKSRESVAAFKKFIRMILADNPELDGTATLGPLTIEMLVELYLDHADLRCRDEDGNAKPELGHIRRMSEVLLSKCPKLLAIKFGPKALKDVRTAMLSVTKTVVKGSGKQKRSIEVPANWSRQFVNDQVQRIRRMFRWAASEELVPITVLQALETVEGLRKGHTKAREGKKVLAVADDQLKAAIKIASPVLATMIQVQRLTGMRSTELCLMRPKDIDRRSSPWEYRPEDNQGQKGSEDPIMLGPKTQKLLKPFLVRAADAYLFSPAENVKWTNEQRWGGAGTAKKKKPRTSKRVGNCYNAKSYYRAIRYLVQRANGDRWHPHQVRHARGTEARKQYGLDGAQVALRHKHADVTQVYAERDLQLARKIARETG